MKPSDLPDPPSTEEARPRDAFLHAAWARLTHGISPIAVAAAYLDWCAHLVASPGKQQELVEKAVRKWMRLALYCATAADPAARPAIEPLPQDRRFAHPDWRYWPFNVLQQSFLFAQQWLWNATTGVRGVSRHHEMLVTFMLRQWLDVSSPSNFPFTNPRVLRETVCSGGLNLAHGAAHWCEDVLRAVGNRPPVVADGYEVGRNLATTPGQVIYRNALIELIQYAPATPSVRPEPILIVPSWILKYYVLDLSPERSLVAHLRERGYTVFMMSWKNPDAEDRDLGLEDYLRRGVRAAIDTIRRIVPDRRLHAAGYCLGGTMLAIEASRQAREGEAVLATATLLAAELDFSEPGELGLFIDESQIAFLEDVMWLRGYLDGKEMAGAFTLLNTADLVWSRMVEDYLLGARRPGTALDAWNSDATRMPYRMHSEYLRRLYLDNALADGALEVDGRPVALGDIRVPLFIVATERDHISPWRSVYKVHLLTDTEVTFVLASGGHNVGIVNPARAPADGSNYRLATHGHDDRYVDPELWCLQAPVSAGSWWDRWTDWLDTRSSAPVEPPTMGAAAAGLVPLCDAPGRYVHAG